MNKGTRLGYVTCSLQPVVRAGVEASGRRLHTGHSVSGTLAPQRLQAGCRSQVADL